MIQGPTAEQNREIFEKMENKAERMWPCTLCHSAWQYHSLIEKRCPTEIRSQVIQTFKPMDNFEYVEFTRRNNEKI